MKKQAKSTNQITKQPKLPRFVSMVDKAKGQKASLGYNNYYYSGMIGEL